jgi:integrase
VFLEFCAVIDGVEPGMRERVRMPNVDPEEESRDDKLDADRASDLLDYFDRFEYASRQQIIVAAIWHTGIRLGSLRAFDLDDFDRSAPCLQFRHRPESETPLKNGEAAERSIALGPQYAEMLDDYIKHNRESVENDHGRRPLLTSKQGRLSETAIRNTVYRVTRPCEIGEYPHDRDPDNCEATRHDRASRCPSSRSPHAIRRGAITRHLREGTPEGVVSDRMHVSSGVLDQHYDQRTEREKMEVRRDFIPNA